MESKKASKKQSVTALHLKLCFKTNTHV